MFNRKTIASLRESLENRDRLVDLYKEKCTLLEKQVENYKNFTDLQDSQITRLLSMVRDLTSKERSDKDVL